jgi:hypothetical protein
MFEALELRGKHVAKLGDEDLRTLVVKLCEAELRRTSRPLSAILAGGNQTATDGGVDVRVQLEADTLFAATLEPVASSSAAAPMPEGEAGVPAEDEESGDAAIPGDFILRADTGYQVKCENMSAGAIKEEMRPKPKGALRESIKELIAKKGAYIIVSSQGTLSDSRLKERKKAMRDAVSDQPTHDDLLVDFYDRDRLARWVREYPGVEQWLRDRIDDRLQGWRGYGAWAGVEVDYLVDETARVVERPGASAARALSVAQGLGQIRKALSRPGQVARLVGLSGTGKTRLVQALFEDKVGEGEALDQALVMYTDLGDEPEPSAREMLLRMAAEGRRVIFVVDNCKPDLHRTLANVVIQHKDHLSLLTVEYDVAEDDEPEATDVFELAPASDTVLEGILQRLVPHLSGLDRHRITEFAGGNARIALALARTVDKGETLGVLNDAELFKRLFRQNQADDPELLRAAQVCSLVYSFEGEDTKTQGAELRVLATLAEMTPRELFGHVGRLKRRDLVQARSKWRAVLPPALANRLAKWALQEIPAVDITDAFEANERLLISFSRRLEYLHDSEEACAIASRWIEDERWLADPAQLSDVGRKLFINLAPLVPGKVLTSLERALDPANAENFLPLQMGSVHDWVALVRHLAYPAAAFDRAALLLLTLAEQEDGNTVDCRGAWKELFRIGLSGTEAPPSQRVKLLERLLATAQGKRRELVWAAVEAMLEANHISSSHDFSFGARPHGYGWQPETHADVVAWFESAFTLLRRIAKSGEDGLRQARTALAGHFREVWACGVDSQLKALMLEVSAGAGWPAGWVATRSVLRFDRKHMTAQSLAALQELDAAMSPKDLEQQVRAFTFGHSGGLLDVVDAVDDSDEAEDRNAVSSYERVNQHVLELGAALAQDDQLLTRLLRELFVEESGRQIYLGQGLGAATQDAAKHWAVLTDAFVRTESGTNFGLLSGFVRGVRRKNPAEALALLEGVVSATKLDACYPALLGAPHDDAEGDMLIASMQRGTARPHQYTLRTPGEDGHGLSVGKFCQAVEVLAHMEKGLLPAIEEVGTELSLRKSRKEPVPPEIAVLARNLLAMFNFEDARHNVAWRVNELAKCALDGPEAASAAAQFAVRFAAAMDNYRTHSEEFGDVACTLFRLQPQLALDAFLSKPNPRRHLGFRARFVARHGSIVQCAPEEVLMQWIAVEPAIRAPLVAQEIDIFSKPTKENASALDDASDEVVLSPLASRLLALAPDKSAVLQAFGRHFSPSHWSGSLAQTLAPHQGLLEKLMVEPDPVVATWAERSLDVMRQRIEQDQRMHAREEQSFE